MQLCRLTRPCEGRIPNKPQLLAGALTDPPCQSPEKSLLGPLQQRLLTLSMIHRCSDLDSMH